MLILIDTHLLDIFNILTFLNTLHFSFYTALNIFNAVVQVFGVLTGSVVPYDDNRIIVKK